MTPGVGRWLARTILTRSQRLRQWCRRSVAEWRTCRACGGQVDPLDDICCHCGAGNPVRISGFQTVLIAVAAAEVMLLLLHLA